MKAQPKQRSHLDFSACGVVFFLECTIGRILMDGRTNIINIVQKQYLLLLEITKCHASLSQTVFSSVLLCGQNWFTFNGHSSVEYGCITLVEDLKVGIVALKITYLLHSSTPYLKGLHQLMASVRFFQ